MSEALEVKAVERKTSGGTLAPRGVNLDRVLAVDPSRFTEVERIAHVSRVRDALDMIANTKRPPAELLGKKIKLLRLWCELVKLRVDSVRADAPPPERQALTTIRDKSSAKLRLASKRAQARKKPSGQARVKPVAVPLNESGRIELRLLDAGTVKGVVLPAGATIEVEAHDAAELLESKMAMRTGGEPRD